MSLIEKLRKACPFEVETGYYSNKKDEGLLELLEQLQYGGGVLVHEKYEDGGRWSNYETKTYKVTEGDNVAYFETYAEVPATERQEGGDFTTEVYEVEPYEVTVTKYRQK